MAALAAVLLSACGTGTGPSPDATGLRGVRPPSPAGRVAAIEAQIAAADNPTVAFVVFDDVSDKARDGIDREVQLAGSGHIEVLCDYAHHQCEDAATKALIQQLGFTPLNPSQYAGVYQKDGAATAHAQALLTERLFLEVLKAAPDYRLTYRNQVQKDPTPLPVPSQ